MGADKLIGNNGQVINQSCLTFERPSVIRKSTFSKSNLVRVTSNQIKEGRSKAYKHLIP